MSLDRKLLSIHSPEERLPLTHAVNVITLIFHNYIKFSFSIHLRNINLIQNIYTSTLHNSAECNVLLIASAKNVRCSQKKIIRLQLVETFFVLNEAKSKKAYHPYHEQVHTKLPNPICKLLVGLLANVLNSS